MPVDEVSKRLICVSILTVSTWDVAELRKNMLWSTTVVNTEPPLRALPIHIASFSTYALTNAGATSVMT